MLSKDNRSLPSELSGEMYTALAGSRASSLITTHHAQIILGRVDGADSPADM